MNAIVAVDKNWGIGRNNDLLVHLPGDLKYYKEKTLEKCVIFGQRTLESLPGGKPLPKRDHVILSDDPSFNESDPRFTFEAMKGYGLDICRTKEEVLKFVHLYEVAAGKVGENPEDAVFVCGGASIYELFLKETDTFYVTYIDKAFDADRFFPNLDEMGLTITWESDIQRDEKTGIEYTFRKYQR